MQRVSRSSWDAFSTWQVHRCSRIQRHPVFRCQKTRHGIQRVRQMENSWRLPRTGHTYEKQGVASFGRIFGFKVVQPLHSPADIPKKTVADRFAGFLFPGNYDISPSRVDGESMLHRAGFLSSQRAMRSDNTRRSRLTPTVPPPSFTDSPRNSDQTAH